MTVEAEAVRRLQRLACRLGEIATLQPAPGPAIPAKRARAALALHEVTEFLDSFKQFQDGNLTAPLKSLALALADLEAGLVGDMLAPISKPGAPPMSSEMQTVMGMSAVALDMLVRFRGLQPSAAAEKVAKTLGSAGFELPPRGKRQPLGKVVLDWRARLNTGPGGAPSFAVEQWRAYERLASEAAVVDVEAWLERLGRVAAAARSD